MSHLSQTDLNTLQGTAASAATYLDACDAGARYVRLDPAYYRACGHLLMTIFSVTNAQEAFAELLEHSAAARDIAESVEIGRRIEVSRLGYYPQLTVILNRASQ